MATTTPRFVTDVLNDFDLSGEPFWEVAITYALRQAAGGHVFADQAERQIWWAESAAFGFSRRADGEKSIWGSTYGPFFSATRDDGTTYHYPDIKEADGETIAYWYRRSQECEHPILQARYADLVWDFTKLIANQEPDVSAARLAIDAYLRAAKLEYRVAIQGVHYVRRALELAFSVGDQMRIVRASLHL